MSELTKLTIRQMRRMLDEKEISSEELTDAFYGEIDARESEDVYKRQQRSLSRRTLRRVWYAFGGKQLYHGKEYE